MSHRTQDTDLQISIPRKNELLMKFWDETKDLISFLHDEVKSEGKYSTLMHDNVRYDVSLKITQTLDKAELDEYMDFIIDGRPEDEYDNSLDNVIKMGEYTYARVDQERVLTNKLLSHFYCGSLHVSSVNQIGEMVHGNVKCSLFFCEKCQSHASKSIVKETGMRMGKFCVVINKTDMNWDTLYRTLKRNDIPYISLPMSQDRYMVIINQGNDKLFSKYDFHGFKVDETHSNMHIGQKAEQGDKIGVFHDGTDAKFPLNKLHLLREHGHAKRQNGVLTGTLDVQDDSDLLTLGKNSESLSEKKEKENEPRYTGLMPYIMSNLPRHIVDQIFNAVFRVMVKYMFSAKDMHGFLYKVMEETIFIIGRDHDDYYVEIGYKMMTIRDNHVDTFNENQGMQTIMSFDEMKFTSQNEEIPI